MTADRRDHHPVPTADNLSRVVKIAVDNGEVQSIEDAYDLFRTYRLGVRVGPNVRGSAAHQAALLTIVNAGRRALLGGVFVEGMLDVPLAVPVPNCHSLADAVRAFGGQIVGALPEQIPTLNVGDAKVRTPTHLVELSVIFSDWRGGVAPGDEAPFHTDDAIVPAAVLAGAIAVSEVFQHLRGNPMAGRRKLGMSLWEPESLNWESAAAGPIEIALPSRLWLIELGHLGQAYLWVLGLLPYPMNSDVQLVLHDFDRLADSNDSTSLLTTMNSVGRHKTREMAKWAEARGFKTRIVERRFPGGLRIEDDEPRLALGGVDNPQARAAYEDAGFDWIVEAGLGTGPTEFLAIRLHTFPASTTARSKWGDSAGRGSEVPATAAYQDLSKRGVDQCGLVQIATRSVGAPFVGAAAAALVIAEVLRHLNGGTTNEVIDLTLRDPQSRLIVPSKLSMKGFNPGFIVPDSAPPHLMQVTIPSGIEQQSLTESI
ncbi:MAG TPA: hypothetical protein VNQ97_11010 [Burkholderiaceae bacterium]|nr:hypothetical protein [Burkholderiaceae bacterium]